MQPEALPHLLEQLREAKDPQSRMDLACLLARFDGQSKWIVPILKEGLRDPKPERQYAAAQSLQLLGTDAAEAVGELVPWLRHTHSGKRAVAAQTLGRIGRAAKPAAGILKSMLKDGRPEMRLVAAQALSRIDPGTGEALDVLRDAFANQKQNRSWFGFVEHHDVFLHREFSPEPLDESMARFGERAVSALADLLDDVAGDEWSADNASSQCGSYARLQAVLLLAKIGPDATTAVPALIRALDDRDPFIRDAAASALGRIGPASKDAAPAFIRLLQRSRGGSAAGTWSLASALRSRAARRFEYGEPLESRSLGRAKVLYKRNGFGYGLDDRDPYWDMRPAHPHDAPYVLSRIDSETRSALPILQEIAKAPHHPDRLAAALSMWRGGSEAPDLLPAFTAALGAHAGLAKSQSGPLPREVRECLAELGTLSKPAIPVMAKWLKRRSSDAALDDLLVVLEAMGDLGAEAKSEAGILRALLQDEPWNTKRRVAAALALYRIRGENDLVFPVLREVWLDSEDRGSHYTWPDPTKSARIHAARALRVLSEKGDEKAKALIAEAAKGDENPHVQVAALEGMAKRKQTHAAALEGLCALLRHPDTTVRSAAASACGRLGTLAKSTEKALEAATEDSHLAVRQAAKAALKAGPMVK